MWNFTQSGHLGCGPDTGNPLGWWACGANEKADWGMYDDVMTFTETEYTFDPGDDGMIYVNKDCSYHSELYLGDGNDYMAPAEKQTVPYQVVKDGGNYYLQLPSQTIFSYMPSDYVYNNGRFLIKRISKDMSIIDLASVDSGIAWFYQFKRVK